MRERRYRKCAEGRGAARLPSLTFSGKGIGFIAGLCSGSADSLCLMRFAAEGDEGSSVALRLLSGGVELALAWRAGQFLYLHTRRTTAGRCCIFGKGKHTIILTGWQHCDTVFFREWTFPLRGSRSEVDDTNEHGLFRIEGEGYVARAVTPLLESRKEQPVQVQVKTSRDLLSFAYVIQCIVKLALNHFRNGHVLELASSLSVHRNRCSSTFSIDIVGLPCVHGRDNRDPRHYATPIKSSFLSTTSPSKSKARFRP